MTKNQPEVKRPTFTCPKCGGHYFGTRGVEDWSKAIGYCTWYLPAVEGSPVRRCDFTWPRAEDEKYGVGP